MAQTKNQAMFMNETFFLLLLRIRQKKISREATDSNRQRNIQQIFHNRGVGVSSFISLALTLEEKQLEPNKKNISRDSNSSSLPSFKEKLPRINYEIPLSNGEKVFFWCETMFFLFLGKFVKCICRATS